MFHRLLANIANTWYDIFIICINHSFCVKVAEFCQPRGAVTSNTPFMGALVDICLKKLKPEHHSVSEYMSKAGSPNNALLKVFKEKDNFRFTEGHVRHSLLYVWVVI